MQGTTHRSTPDDIPTNIPTTIYTRRSPRLMHQPSRPAAISQAALNAIMGNIFLAEMKETVRLNEPPPDIEEVANGVVHPVTNKTITKYKKIIADPLLRETWSKAMAKELGRLAQGFGDTERTDTIRFMDLESIKNIPRDRVITYARIVVDYRAHKKDPNRVRITAGGT